MKTIFSILSLAAVLSLSSCATCPFAKKECSSCDASAKKECSSCDSTKKECCSH